MADEYVVRIVLDGVDNASDDIEKVGDEIEELGNSTKGLNFDMMAFTGGMALTVGALNQFTGGLRKSLGAAERLGVGTEESREQLATYLDLIELFVGPLEAIIALFVLVGGAMTVVGTSAFQASAASIGLTTAASALGLTLGGLVAIIVGVTLAVVALGVAFIFYRDEVNSFARELRQMADFSDELNAALKRVIDTINGVGNAIRSSGNLVENFDGKLRNSISGAGGSITRLAGPVQ